MSLRPFEFPPFRRPFPAAFPDAGVDFFLVRPVASQGALDVGLPVRGVALPASFPVPFPVIFEPFGVGPESLPPHCVPDSCLFPVRPVVFPVVFLHLPLPFPVAAFCGPFRAFVHPAEAFRVVGFLPGYPVEALFLLGHQYTPIISRRLRSRISSLRSRDSSAWSRWLGSRHSRKSFARRRTRFSVAEYSTMAAFIASRR